MTSCRIVPHRPNQPWPELMGRKNRRSIDCEPTTPNRRGRFLVGWKVTTEPGRVSNRRGAIWFRTDQSSLRCPELRQSEPETHSGAFSLHPSSPYQHSTQPTRVSEPSTKNIGVLTAGYVLINPTIYRCRHRPPTPIPWLEIRAALLA